MSKLRLDLEAIRVDTFETAAVDGPRGTVKAHQCCCNPCCCTCCATCGGTCPGENTCGGTCPNDYTCGISCESCWYTCPDYGCGNTLQGAYTCDFSLTGGGWGVCECCPM